METNFNAQEHNAEIKASRVGGLGGSDAKMVLKIGYNGLAALSNTDKERLAVMMGQAEYKEFEPNAAMIAGHLFEDMLAAGNFWGNEDVKDMWKREYKMTDGFEQFNGLSFKLFAHADFYKDGYVIEAKYSQKDTIDVMDTYNAQFQWYYMLGAKGVRLCHGWGSVEPFEVEDIHIQRIERNEQDIKALERGVKLIEEYVREHKNDGAPASTEMVTDKLPQEQQSNVIAIRTRLSQIKFAEDKLADMKAELLAWMEANNVTHIEDEQCTVTYTSATSKRTFNSKKAQADFPALKEDKYFNVVPVKSSITFKLKENGK